MLLELARHIGEKYDRPLARRQLDKLREDANSLAGIGREGLPMKWYAFARLTESAVELQAFDRAEAWLADTIAEVKQLELSGASIQILEEVRQLMTNFPEHVASKHADFRRRAAGLN